MLQDSSAEGGDMFYSIKGAAEESAGTGQSGFIYFSHGFDPEVLHACSVSRDVAYT